MSLGVLLLAPLAAGARGAEAQAAPAPPAVPAEAGDALAGTLTLEAALAYAGRHAVQPLVARLYRDAARARVAEQRAPLLPQATAQVSYQRTTSNYVLRPGSLPSNLMPATARAKNKSFNFFAGQVQIAQLLFDFGSSYHGLRASKSSLRAQDHNVRLSDQTTGYAVTAAYLAAFAAQGMVEVGQRTRENMQRHLDQIERGVAAGTQAAIDVSTAQSNLGAAEVTLLGYENALVSDKIALNQAIGYEGEVGYQLTSPKVPDGPPRSLAERIGPRVQCGHSPLHAREGQGPAQERGGGREAARGAWQATPADEAALVDEALGNRPEVAQLALQREAQAHHVASLQAQRFPSLGVTGTLSEQGEELHKLTYNWQVLGTLSWQASTGGLLTAQLAEARALLAALDATMRSVRLLVRAGVQNAVLDLAAGEAARRAAALARESANARLGLAEGRFRAGVGNIIELSDAQLSAASAAADAVQADYRWLLAHAQWQLALGCIAEREAGQASSQVGDRPTLHRKATIDTSAGEPR